MTHPISTPARTSSATAARNAMPSATQERAVMESPLSPERAPSIVTSPPPDPEERLTSGKAVSAALLLAAVVFAALAVFLWVVFSRACGGPSI